MVDKEMLAAMSEMMDEKLEQKLEQKLDEKFDQKLRPVFDRLDRLESDMKIVRVAQLENTVLPLLNTLAGYYTDVSQRYIEKADQIDVMSGDISVLQSAVANHSERLNRAGI